MIMDLVCLSKVLANSREILEGAKIAAGKIAQQDSNHRPSQQASDVASVLLVGNTAYQNGESAWVQKCFRFVKHSMSRFHVSVASPPTKCWLSWNERALLKFINNNQQLSLIIFITSLTIPKLREL